MPGSYSHTGMRAGEKVKYVRCVPHPVPPSIGPSVLAPTDRLTSASYKCRRPITAHLSNPWNDPIRKTVNLVIFEDSPELLSIYVRRLRRIEGVKLPYKKTVNSPDEAISLFRNFRPEIVITDLALTVPARADGIDILREIKRISPGTPVGIATCFSPDSTELTIETIKRAGFDAIFNKSDTLSMANFIRLNTAKIRFG
jgi:CheY-like chemotaxis protein